MKKIFCIMLSILLIAPFSACKSDKDNMDSISQNTDKTLINDTSNLGETEELSQYEINFPSYKEVAEQYPDKTILVWTIQETLYEKHYSFRTREINEYLNSIDCDYVLCFEPLSYEITQAYPDAYVREVEELISSGYQIDIISPMNYGEFVYAGLYTPLDEFFLTEDGAKLYSLMPEKFWESLRINGSIYGINTTALYTLSLDWGYYVNAELAQKYNYDVTKSVLDQLDILQAVKENEKNTDVFSTNLYISNIIHSTDVKEIVPGIYWNEETHSAECVLDNSEYIEKLHLYDTLNSLNLLNDMNRMTSDSFFIMQDNVVGGYKYNDTIELIYNGNEVNAIPVFNVKTSIRNCPAATGICSYSENKEKAFKLISLIYTDPILNNILTYGIEGEDFNCDNDTVDTVVNPFNTIRFANDLICYNRNNSTLTADRYRAVYENASVHEDQDFVFDGRELADEICAVANIMNNFALPGTDGEKTLDKVLAETRAMLEQAGLNRLIDECNRQYEVYVDEKS